MLSKMLRDMSFKTSGRFATPFHLRAKKKSCSAEVVWYNSFGKSASGLTLWSLRGREAGQGVWSEGRTSEEGKATRRVVVLEVRKAF
jgi:hypothetical protein